MDDKRNIIKLFIIALELISVGALILNGKENAQNEMSDNEYEEVIFQENSYYTDATIEPEKIHREFTITKWLTCIRNGEISQSFDMLTNECKDEKYSNEIEKYKDTVVNLVTQEELTNVSFVLLSENYSNNIGYAEYIINLGEIKLNIVVEDKGPFSQLIDIKGV